MNMDEILTLVQAVSDSKLTSFKLDQGDMHISLKKEKEEAKIITVGAPGAVAAVPAPSAAPVVTAASAGVSTEAPAAAPEAAEPAVEAAVEVLPALEAAQPANRPAAARTALMDRNSRRFIVGSPSHFSFSFG